MYSPAFRALFALLCAAASLRAAEPDFAAARAETVKILSGFIAVDTSNPPGNETAGAVYLKGILDREGIASEILELEKGRGSLVARLKGNGRARPLLLMGHIDVVGVEKEKWTVPPFGGVVREGYIYGRGAADDKGMTSACLQVFLMLSRLKVPLDRDVIFLAESGEEGTTHVGIDFLVAKHWEKIACEFALNEGGRIVEQDGKVRYVGVATTEKVPRPILLSAKGSSGHGSRPRPDNALTHLAAAVAKVGTWQAPPRLNETTRAYFARLAELCPPEEAFLLRHLEDPELSPLVQEKLRTSYGAHHAMLRTTLTPTMFKAGFRINVIPGDALAHIDCRALPDEDMAALAQTLRRVINDPAIEVVVAERGRPVAPPSRLDTALYRALERAQRKVFPQAQTLPLMLTGATDSAQLRARGVQAYGIGSVMSDADIARFHGNDERLSIDGLGRFLEFLWAAVTDIAASK